MDGSAPRRTWRDHTDEIRYFAKLRVVGSNPAVLSRETFSSWADVPDMHCEPIASCPPVAHHGTMAEKLREGRFVAGEGFIEAAGLQRH